MQTNSETTSSDRRPRGRAAGLVTLLELIALGAAAPFLLFPSLWPRGVLVGLGAVLLAAIARGVFCREIWPATPFNIALALFVVMLPVAVWASALPDLTQPKLLGIILGLLAFRLIALGIHDRRTLAWGLLIFAAVGVGILVLGTLSTEWSSKISILRPILRHLPKQLTELPGAGGQATNANQLAGAIMFYLPVTIALAVGWWRERRRWLAAVALLSGGMVAGLLLLTQSRSGWIGGAGGLMAFAILIGLASRRRKIRTTVLILSVVLIVALGGALMILGSRGLGALWPADEALSAQDVVGPISLSGRVEIWSRALYAIQDFPFTGTGLGTFRKVVHLLYPLFTISPDTDFAHAHNMFLQVALDMGLPGLIAYLALLWIAVATAWPVARRGSPLPRALAVGLLAALAGVHLYGLTDALALGSKPSLAFWMNLGMLAALPKVAERDRSP